MTTVLLKLSEIKKKLIPLSAIKANLFTEKNFEKFFSSNNLKEIESSFTPKDLLELKKKEWNISYNLKNDVKPELQKKLFEIYLVQLGNHPVELKPDPVSTMTL